jgi:hypothetical protein
MLLTSIYILPAYSQDPALEASKNASIARIDLAVPDAPAFKVLGVQPSNIMRPSTVREVGISVGNLLESGGVLPKAFAAEFSPAMLLGGSDLSLKKYQDNRFLYRSRISIGTESMQDGTTDLAIGFRFTLLDESDLRTNKAFTDSLTSIVTAINQARDASMNYVILKVLKMPMEDYASLDDNDPKKKEIDEMIDGRASASRSALDTKIVKTREAVRELNWNKSIIDLGFAILGSSPDSLAKNLQASKYAVWATGGFPLGADGQILVGLNGTLTKDDLGKFAHGQGSVVIRGYYGSNFMKGFMEGSGNGSDNLAATYDLNLGAELRMTDGLWLDMAVGLMKRVAEGAQISTSLNLRFATPELKN